MGSKDKIFEGVLEGTVSGEPIIMVSGGQSITSSTMYLSFKLYEIIEGLPEEFVVFASYNRFAYVRKGDDVVIEGKLYEVSEKKHELSFYHMELKKIYNKTLQTGT